MRTRSSVRQSWFDSSSAVPNMTERPNRQSRRRPRSTSQSNPSPSSSSEHNQHPPPIQTINPTYPTTSTAPLLSSDAILRNVAFVSVLFALGLMFLNIALYVAVVSVGILVPAWRTFKTLERPSQQIDIIEIDDELIHIPSPSQTQQQLQNEQQNSARDLEVEMRNWHKYWILTGFIFALHCFLINPFVSTIVPDSLYKASLLSLFTWLNSYKASNAARIYDTFIKPTLSRSEHTIDVAVESLLTYLDSFTQHIILGVNQAVEPYARQLGHAADITRRRIEEQTHRDAARANYFN